MSSIQTAPEQFEVLKQSTTLVAPAGVGVAATEPEYQFDAQRTIGSLAQSLASVHQVVIEQDSLLWESQLCITTLDLVFISYYLFLIRPGKYTGLPHHDVNQCPLFILQDAQLWISHRRLAILHCPLTISSMLPSSHSL